MARRRQQTENPTGTDAANPDAPDSAAPLKRFKSFAKRLLRVSKQEIQEQEQHYKAQQTRKQSERRS
jgi:exonuclease VII large subunit